MTKFFRTIYGIAMPTWQQQYFLKYQSHDDQRKNILWKEHNEPLVSTGLVVVMRLVNQDNKIVGYWDCIWENIEHRDHIQVEQVLHPYYCITKV